MKISQLFALTATAIALIKFGWPMTVIVVCIFGAIHFDRYE